MSCSFFVAAYIAWLSPTASSGYRRFPSLFWLLFEVFWLSCHSLETPRLLYKKTNQVNGFRDTAVQSRSNLLFLPWKGKFLLSMMLLTRGEAFYQQIYFNTFVQVYVYCMDELKFEWGLLHIFWLLIVYIRLTVKDILYWIFIRHNCC